MRARKPPRSHAAALVLTSLLAAAAAFSAGGGTSSASGGARHLLAQPARFACYGGQFSPFTPQKLTLTDRIAVRLS